MADDSREIFQLDRRQLLALTGLTGVGLGAPALAGGPAAAGVALAGAARPLRAASRYPHDNLRDWMAELEERGLVMRVDRLDQDAFEMTALAYRLMDCFGWYEAPAVLAEEVRIDGQWRKGPVIFNHQGHWDAEALVFGLEPIPGHGKETYKQVMAWLGGLLDDNDGALPQIPPVEIARDRAPVKEIVVTGDAIDIGAFPFIVSNPGDSGRYVNTGSVFTDDAELGKNFGTYRCEIKGPRRLGVNPEPGQGAWKAFTAAKKRGEKRVPIAIVLGQDPVTWVMSGSSVSKDGTDELALSGGLRGKPVETVKCETNDLRVPAHAEMVIEGYVPLDEPMLPEGPFGEMYGYMSIPKTENFWMEITAITHRKNPWILNQFTGVTRGFCTAPLEAVAFHRLKRFVPNAKAFHSPVEATGLTFMSIRKTEPGQALKIGETLAKVVPIAKVIVIVDDDFDVYDRQQMMYAIGSSWQPYPATKIIESARGMPLDPSSPDRPKSSKIVIDATRQWPEEGGPEVYTRMNRRLLEELAPQAFASIDRKFGRIYGDWLKKYGVPRMRGARA